ncbi:hypothetical protein ACIBM3_22895 [Rhodococcus erythropolis]|uniref:hypothetical protein n=1 Tax=Rhodococcus erythropolis TaxID=1833 RepID=UPI003792D0B3
MTGDKSPVPLPGRIAGLALAILGLAIAARVAWAIIEPLLPALVTLAVLLVIYLVMFGKFKP